MRLENKVIVITGGGGGMGRAIATLFAAEGARLMLGEWNEQSLAEALAEIRGLGGKATMWRFFWAVFRSETVRASTPVVVLVN